MAAKEGVPGIFNFQDLVPFIEASKVSTVSAPVTRNKTISSRVAAFSQLSSLLVSSFPLPFLNWRVNTFFTQPDAVFTRVPSTTCVSFLLAQPPSNIAVLLYI